MSVYGVTVHVWICVWVYDYIYIYMDYIHSWVCIHINIHIHVYIWSKRVYCIDRRAGQFLTIVNKHFHVQLCKFSDTLYSLYFLWNFHYEIQLIKFVFWFFYPKWLLIFLQHMTALTMCVIGSIKTYICQKTLWVFGVLRQDNCMAEWQGWILRVFSPGVEHSLLLTAASAWRTHSHLLE